MKDSGPSKEDEEGGEGDNFDGDDAWLNINS